MEVLGPGAASSTSILWQNVWTDVLLAEPKLVLQLALLLVLSGHMPGLAKEGFGGSEGRLVFTIRTH
jgi:hypothetical protein